jgi:hypothetical protein
MARADARLAQAGGAVKYESVLTAIGQKGSMVMSRRTTRHSVFLIAAVYSVTSIGTARANIDLLYSPATQTVLVDTVVEIDLVVRSDDDTTQYFAALDAILGWDPTYLDLIGVDDSGAGYPFGPENHFMPDADGINDDLHDGDALFTALALGGEEAPVPPEGLVVTTLQFLALAETDGTVVSFFPTLGEYGITRIRRLDLTDVTGDISATGTVTILAEAPLGDCDTDLDVDLEDYSTFYQCLDGPQSGPVTPTCQCADLDEDDDVDLTDFVLFQRAFTGPL